MGAAFATVWTLARKDLLLELRSRDIVLAIVVFGLLVITIFTFAIELTPSRSGDVGPGVLWAAVAFAGVLGLNRSFALEKDGGNIHGLMTAPVGRDVIFFGKMLGNFLFMIVVEVLIFPVFAVMYNFSLFMPGLIPIALLATLAVATVGTVFSAMAVNTRSREVMLPILFFPVVVPAIVAAVEASASVIQGDGNFTRWLPFLAVFDAIFLVVSPLASQFIIEE